MSELSERVKELVRSRIPAGMYCYGGMNEVNDKFAEQIRRKTRVNVRSEEMRQETFRPIEQIKPIKPIEPIEPIDPIDDLLSDGKTHIIAATWCGACNMQKALASGYFPLPVYNRRGKRKEGEQKWVKIDEVTKEDLDKIHLSVEQFKDLISHALPKDAMKYIEFHYIDDPNPEKRELAKMLQDAYQAKAFPSFIKRSCNWKEKGEQCLDSGVKFKEAFVKFIVENARGDSGGN